MALDAQSALAAANCYECYAANPYMLGLIELGLLRQMLLTINPSADVSPQTLMAQARCYECYAPNDYSLGLLKLALLNQLVTNTST